LNEKRPLLSSPLVVHATLTASLLALLAESNPPFVPLRVFAKGLSAVQEESAQEKKLTSREQTRSPAQKSAMRVLMFSIFCIAMSCIHTVKECLFV
jgi:hypothetical protein